MTSEWPFNPSQTYDQMVQDVKESFGYSHAPTPTPYVSLSQVETSHPNYRSPQGKRRKATPVTSTGSSVWRSPRKSLLPQLLACLEEESMPSSPVPKQQPPTAPRKSQDLPSLSALAPSPFEEIREQTGMQYGPPPSPEIWTLSQPMSVWFLIVPCEPSGQTSQLVEECLEQFSCFGVLRVRANLIVHGQKQELTLILSVHDPSSGMATRINRMLWSMNFEGVINFNLIERNRCCALITLDRPLPCTCRDQGFFQTTQCK